MKSSEQSWKAAEQVPHSAANARALRELLHLAEKFKAAAGSLDNDEGGEIRWPFR